MNCKIFYRVDKMVENTMLYTKQAHCKYILFIVLFSDNASSTALDKNSRADSVTQTQRSAAQATAL